MVVNIHEISINTDPSGFDSGQDYADMLQELADELDAFRNFYRSQLKRIQKNHLRFGSQDIRRKARDISTIDAIEKLQSLDNELSELRMLTQQMDTLIKDIQKAKEVISGITKVLESITRILTLAF